MKSRLFVFLATLAAGFSFVMSFLACVAEDTQGTSIIHYGDVSVAVQSADSLDGAARAQNGDSVGSGVIRPFVSAQPEDAVIPVASSEAYATFRLVAEKYGVTIIRTVADARHPASHRTAYVLAPEGSSAESWLEEGYPDIAPSIMSTETRKFDDSERFGVTGDFTLTGADRVRRHDAAEELAQKLSQMGYMVQGIDQGIVATALVLGDDFIEPSALALLMCGLLAMMYALLNAKGYAVKRLHGFTKAGMWLDDIRANTVDALLALCLVTAAGAIFCEMYNGCAQFGRQLRGYVALLACFFVIIALFHALGMHLCMVQPILQGLQGGIPLGPATLAMYVIRVPAALISMAAVSALLVAGATAAQIGSGLNEWRGEGDIGYVQGFNGTVTSEQEADFNRWFAEQVSSGRVIRSYAATLGEFCPTDMATGDADSSCSSAYSQPALIVNSTYLTRQVVRAADGTRVDSIPEGKVLVMIPQELEAQSQMISQAVAFEVHRTWVRTRLIEEYGDDFESHLDSNEFENQAGPGIVTLVGEPGQRFFDYRFVDNTTQSDRSQSRADAAAPVLIGIDASSGVDSWMEYSNQNSSMFFTDPDAAWEDARRSGLETVIYAIATPTETIDSAVAFYMGKMRLAAVSLLLGVLVLVMSGIALARTHVEANAQRVFAEYVHGWPFVRIHAGLIACESALFGILIFAGARKYRALALSADVVTGAYDVSPMTSLAEVVVVCIVSVAVSLVSAAVFTRRLCAAHARLD